MMAPWRKDLTSNISLSKTLFEILMFVRLTSDRSVCAIPDTENEGVIITGGAQDSQEQRKVAIYSKAGWEMDLPPLSQGRSSHACSSFTNEGNKVFRLLFAKFKF